MGPHNSRVSTIGYTHTHTHKEVFYVILDMFVFNCFNKLHYVVCYAQTPLDVAFSQSVLRET